MVIPFDKYVETTNVKNMKREHFVLGRVHQTILMDLLICTVCRLRPPSMFYFSSFSKRPETDCTGGFYIEAFATIVFVCMLSMMLFNSGNLVFSGHTQKQKEGGSAI